MNTKLTIQEKLKDLRVERHLTLEQLAEETGISKSALGKYESDDFKDISPFSIVTLAKFYGVSTDYLLGLTETKNHPNTDLHDLHLGDDMIELLKSGKLNNRLLSELALHKDFQRFLVDIEIFVDRVADMRINDMNAILEANRKQIMEKHNPGENDLYVRTLELAQVSEKTSFPMWFIRTLTASYMISGKPTGRTPLLQTPLLLLPKFKSRWRPPCTTRAPRKKRKPVCFWRLLALTMTN